MAHFIWNNISSKDMNVVVKKLPSHTKPNERTEKITVPGRDGDLTISDNTYESSSFSIECGLKKDADLYAVTNWLRGSGALVLSDDEDKYYEAEMTNAIPFNIIFKYWRNFVIQFKAQPFMKSVTGKTVTLTPSTLSTMEEVEGTYKALPTITVNGTGTFVITINSHIFTLTGVTGSIVIDSELMNCTESNGLTNANNKLSMGSDFPVLESGENTISIAVTSGSFTTCVIAYKDRWF